MCVCVCDRMCEREKKRDITGYRLFSHFSKSSFLFQLSPSIPSREALAKYEHESRGQLGSRIHGTIESTVRWVSRSCYIPGYENCVIQGAFMN